MRSGVRRPRLRSSVRRRGLRRPRQRRSARLLRACGYPGGGESRWAARAWLSTLAPMPMTDSVTWAQLPFEDEAELVSLAGRCLAADGGLPLAADPAFLRGRWRAADISTVQGRDHAGRLVAAGAARPTTATGGVTFCGLVDPGARDRGIGTHLL